MSEATSEVAIAPVCEEAARDPACVLPPFTTSTGFLADTLRAIRANFCAFPKYSRLSSMTFVFRFDLPIFEKVVGRYIDPDFSGTDEVEMPRFRFLAYSRYSDRGHRFVIVELHCRGVGTRLKK